MPVIKPSYFVPVLGGSQRVVETDPVRVESYQDARACLLYSLCFNI